MELTNNIVKIVASLGQKKNRIEQGCFIAEGNKCVHDTWNYFNCRWIIATNYWYERFGTFEHQGKILIANKNQMAKMSQLTTPTDVIAVYDLPKYEISDTEIKDNLSIVLDNIQDPGNFGTIIRIADWYGIKNIICSITNVDAFSPKVIQATMGAISRVKVHYADLESILEEYSELPIYGTFLEGDDIYHTKLEDKGLVVFGNEGKGITPEVAQLINKKLFIPPYPRNVVTSESLNVGVATAITISEFRRNLLK